jgi:hypothetical protein
MHSVYNRIGSLVDTAAVRVATKHTDQNTLPPESIFNDGTTHNGTRPPIRAAGSHHLEHSTRVIVEIVWLFSWNQPDVQKVGDGG